jgi:hypothetical protein
MCCRQSEITLGINTGVFRYYDSNERILVQVLADVDTDDMNTERDKMRVWGTRFCRSAEMHQHMLPNTCIYVINVRLRCSLIGGFNGRYQVYVFHHLCQWPIGGTGWYERGRCM